MKQFYSILLFSLLISFQIIAQENPLNKFDPLIGKWAGTGAGFGSSKSVIHSEFNRALNDNFIEVKNHSEFEPTPQNQEGEIHEDWGMISFDNDREVYVFRQFHVEGFVNQYILNDSVSTNKKFVFESENIENFVPGGIARFTINIKNNSEIETIFDVGMPGQEMVCYGTNQLKKQ